MTMMERTFPVLESLWPERWRRLFDFDLDLGLGGWLRVEEFADADTLVVRAEMPGIDPDKDVEVTVSGGMLHIRATRSERKEDTTKGGYRSEFRYGTLERDVLLPEGVTGEDVNASYTDGILEIRVPMPKAPEVTKVAITHKAG
ncbi:MAG TPA: Hsp20/alpha crystallin family protein [Acidimicrobiales bacterium]|nr:Hsp20/alpha crystallin family protein [Acidimicrobiales bacterium]